MYDEDDTPTACRRKAKAAKKRLVSGDITPNPRSHTGLEFLLLATLLYLINTPNQLSLCYTIPRKPTLSITHFNLKLKCDTVINTTPESTTAQGEDAYADIQSTKGPKL